MKYHFKNLNCLLFFFCFSWYSFADEITETTKNNLITDASFSAGVDEVNEAIVGQWQLGIAVGLGTITNPLQQGKNIFLPLIPRVSYYGERFFLENTDLGYAIFENEQVSFNLYGRFNEDKRYFAYASTADILVTSSGWGLGDHFDPTLGSQLNSTKVELSKRELSYLAGIQLHYHNNNYNAKLSILSDVTNVHHGEEIELSLTKSWSINNFFAEIGLGVLWKSSKIVDYYYGIQPEEISQNREEYYPGDSFTPYLKSTLQYKITEEINFLTSLKIDRQDSARFDSPIVKERFIYSTFIGFSYDF